MPEFIATKIGPVNLGYKAKQVLYRLSPPLQHTYWDHDNEEYEEASYDYVITSAIDSEWGMETYVFPSNEDGEITDWEELPGSRKGTTDNDIPLLELGYTLLEGDIIDADGAAVEDRLAIEAGGTN